MKLRFKNDFLRVALPQKVLKDSYFSKTIFQITIPSRKFEFPAHDSKQFIQTFCSE